jgi:hypothetical protein
VRSRVSEDGAEELRGAVGDEVLLGERGRAVHQHQQLHDAADAIQVARRGFERAEEVDRDRARGSLAGGGVELLTQLAGPRDAIALRNVAGEEDQVAGPHPRHERRRGRGGWGEGDL